MTKQIVVATGNVHKLQEINTALRFPDIEFISIFDVAPNWESPEETGDTFEANATIKALAAFDATGMPCLADDSGLEVDALEGQPGVFSARYAGIEQNDERNNQKLLTVLKGIALPDRTARFVSTLVLIGLDLISDKASAFYSATGTIEGLIIEEPRGDKGFGYDPLFVPYATPGKTFAELSMEEKNNISHRGTALRILAQKLEDEKIFS